MANNETVIVSLGPWGGPGGTAFDDGSENGAVTSVTIYWQDYVRGLEVVYANAGTILHGARFGSAQRFEPGSSGLLAHANVAIGKNSHFSGDYGVVGLAFSIAGNSTIPPSPPANSLLIVRPQIVGFYGRASGGAIDQLGFYLSTNVSS